MIKPLVKSNIKYDNFATAVAKLINPTNCLAHNETFFNYFIKIGALDET